MVSVMSCAREAIYRSISQLTFIMWCLLLSRISRISSPMIVLPGSRTEQTGMELFFAKVMKRLKIVVLPEPSGPSKTMNFPARFCSHW